MGIHRCQRSVNVSFSSTLAPVGVYSLAEVAQESIQVLLGLKVLYFLLSLSYALLRLVGERLGLGLDLVKQCHRVVLHWWEWVCREG